eukprot:c5418_g1_i1.p1 GENE.c5418_g1_i1~~c5418_g1_i1.p1  ORF type:complete len:536 (+),score=112.30 c5418_g1_i1:25-1632(+)
MRAENHFFGRSSKSNGSSASAIRVILCSVGQKRTPQDQGDGAVRELVSLKKELVTEVPMAMLDRVPYLADLLNSKKKANPSDDTGDEIILEEHLSTTEQRVLRLSFSKTSPTSPEAVMACLEFVCSEGESKLQLDSHNQFQMLAASSMLRVRPVAEQCIQFVAKNLSPLSVATATKFALKLGSPALLEACYYFTKGLLLPASSSIPNLSQSIKIDVLGSKKKKTQQQQLLQQQQQQNLDDDTVRSKDAKITDDGNLQCGNLFVSLAVFAEIAKQDLGHSLRFNRASFIYDLYFVDQLLLNESSLYPRVYRMCHDHNSEFVMLAYQHDEFADFVISSSPSLDFRTQQVQFSASYLGTVTSNFLGTEFYLYDGGVVPNAVSHIQAGKSPFRVRRELSHVVFDRNVMGSQPRALKARVPARLAAQDPYAASEVTNSQNTSSQSQESDDLDTNNSVEFVNKPPFWSEENECWMLDFFGRVNLASAKNFQLVQGQDGQEVFLMFGKMTETRYALDFRYPLSPLQAFGIGLAGIARKLAVN